MKPGQLTWPERGALWLRLGIRIVLAVVIVWVLMRFGRPVLSLFAPFVAALITAAILNPLVRWFQRRIGWSRQVLTLLLLLVLLGLLGAGISYLAYSAALELASLMQNWDGLLGSLQTALDQLEALSAHLWNMVPPQLNDSLQSVVDGIVAWLEEAVPALLNSAVDYTKDKAMGVPSFVIALVIYLMATYFLTADYPYLRARAVQHMDEGLLRFFSQVRVTALGAFGGYLKAEFLLSVGVFFILLGGFLLVGQNYALLLALGLAILDFIPIIGSGTVMVPWAVVALFTRDFSTAVYLMVIWGVVAMFRRVAEPRFVGDQTGLSPILSLVGIYVGMKVAGVAGMILGPILILVVLNLVGLGIFQGFWMDVTAAARDITAILSQRPERK